MTVVGKSWSRLTLPGKVIFTALPILLVLTLALVGVIALFASMAVLVIAAFLAGRTSLKPTVVSVITVM